MSRNQPPGSFPEIAALLPFEKRNAAFSEMRGIPGTTNKEAK